MLKRFMVLALVPVLFVLGCANPADDKPEAKVSDATHEAAPTPGHTEGTHYVFAEGSSITWVGSKVTRKHDGGFHAFTGSFHLVNNDPTQSSVQVDIDATSIWADNERLTGHLKSTDFFDVETYPTASFESASIVRESEGYTVTGNLTLHGVTKGISFPATIQVAPDQITAQAEFFIKRFDFGIEYKGKADDLIRDEVVVKLDIVAKPEVGMET